MSELTGKRYSKIWSHFTIIGQSRARCNICKNKFSFKTTTSNLKKHFEKRHAGIKLGIARRVKWDSKAKNPRSDSPVSSDAGSANITSDSAAVDPTASSSFHPDDTLDQNQPFKKIKLAPQNEEEHFEEPFTEGYLEDFEQNICKTSRRSSPPPRPAPSRPPKQSRAPPRQDENKHICTSCPCIAAQENQYDKIGKVWASELKLMTFDQQIFAKRAISEILFEGQLGGLNRDSVMLRRHGDPFVVEESDFVYDKSDANVVPVS